MDKMTLQSCAREYGTPLYVYDFDTISAQFSAFKEAFKARKSLICYALKANSNLSIINHLAKLGCGADCVSIGEVKQEWKNIRLFLVAWEKAMIICAKLSNMTFYLSMWKVRLNSRV